MVVPQKTRATTKGGSLPAETTPVFGHKFAEI
jgi:hypothetical protein